MALTNTTTQDVYNNIIAQLQSSLSTTIPLLPKSFLRVLSKVLAGVFILLYKYGNWMFLQWFVKTAAFKTTDINGSDISPLKEWGRLVGEGDPDAATNAELLIDITVTNQLGSIPAGTQLLGQSNGVTYLTLASTALTAATVQATVRAVNDQQGGSGAGTIGNLEAGAIMNFANPIANVARSAAVNSAVVTAVDAETVEDYRQSILDRFQKRPQGGASADYDLWGKTVEGIVNIYPYTSDCPGQVDVYVEANTDTDPDGIPTTAQLTAVLAAINLDDSGLATRRPLNSLANTFAITRTAFDVVVSSLSVENPTQTQSDIEDALEEYFLAAEPFISGLTATPRTDIITQSAVGGVVQEVVSAAGGLFDGAVLKEGAATITVRALTIGEKAKAGTVSFI